MYNLNTLEGKKTRIIELEYLVSRIGNIPGNYLNYQDASATIQYLVDVKSDLEKQVRMGEGR